jgi:hypothetical protein
VALLSSTSGRVGDTIDVTPKRDSDGDWELRLEYLGGSVVSDKGRHSNAGVPFVFSYQRFEPLIAWTTSFYTWADSTADPRQVPNAMEIMSRTSPIAIFHVPRLDMEGYRALANLPREKLAMEATGWVDLAPGVYTLRTISDDAIRVWVDGVLAIDDWKPHESALDFASLKGGRHNLRVEYYQADGWYELRVEIVRGADRSRGSPGAHGSD